MKLKKNFEESKALIDLIINHLPVFVAYVDSDQRYRFNNKMYEDRFGIPREEIYGQHIKEFLGGAVHEVIKKYIELALSGKKVHQELVAPYKSGGTRSISMSFVPHITAEEKVAGFFVMVEDITERKRTEQELEKHKNDLEEIVKERTEKLLGFAETLEKEILLRKKAEEKIKESEEKYRGLFNQLRSIVEAVSSKSSVEFFRLLTRHLASSLNLRYAFIGKLGERRKDEVKTLAVWAGKDYAENFVYALANTPCENVIGQTFCCYPKDIQKLFPKDHLLKELNVESYLGIPLFDSSHKPLGILAVMHDRPIIDEENAKIVISIFATQAESEMERQKAEEKLKRYSEELERSNQALNDFAAIASHDLQEPLRKVMLFSGRLKDRYTDVLDTAGKDYLLRMQKATERMRHFIDDLLQYSKVASQAKIFRPTNLETIVAEVFLNLKLRISESGGRVEVNRLPVLDADELQMRQLFQNLLGNALKFHREGVPPVIALNSRPLDNNFWEITIEDNGIGFSQKSADQIFKPFERLHSRSAYEGSGMGLSICQKIVERHGGTITTKSAPQKGTTMIVTLPEKQTQEES